MENTQHKISDATYLKIWRALYFGYDLREFIPADVLNVVQKDFQSEPLNLSKLGIAHER